MAKKKIVKKIRHFLKRNFILVIIIVIASLFLINLSGQDYSLDETETVTVARTVLQYGVPSAWNGVNFISGSGGLDSIKINDLYIWRWHPWMQHYFAAGGIMILGDSVASTRLPFALFGIFTVILLYFVAQELFKNKFISFLLSTQLVFLLPFFLYVRNVRYYSPAAFFSLVSIFLVFRYLKGKWGRTSTILFFISTFLLFHANYLIWASSITIFFIIFWLKRNNTILILMALQVIFALGWFWIFKPYGGNIGVSMQRGIDLFINLFHYISYINSYIFPLILIPIFFFIFRSLSRNFLILIFIVGIKLLFYTVFLYAHGRYLMDLFPLFILFYGFIYQYFIKKRYWYLCVLLFVIVISTNLLSLVFQWPLHPDKAKLQFWLNNYKIELTQRYQTVLPQVGEYLQKNYRKGDLFWSNTLSYNYTKVPSISPLWDKSTGTFKGPSSVADTEKVRWFVYFKSDKSLLDYIINDPRFGEKWRKKIEYDYIKYTFNYDKNTVVINDVDIYNRQFPPGIISQGQVEIYEKKK